MSSTIAGGALTALSAFDINVPGVANRSKTVIVHGSPQETLSFDAVIRHAMANTAEITQHPIEKGANISDHIRRNLDAIEIQAWISNHPIKVPEDNADGASRLPLPFVAFGDNFDRVRTVHDLLLRLLNKGETVEIVTGLRSYQNMLIHAVSPLRNAETGDAMLVTIGATELRQVESSQAQGLNIPAEPRGNVGQSRGRKAPTPEPRVDDVASASENRSIIHNLAF